ncbi:hypothetical protein [Streptomyces gamaensis]|uniref:hypothetical protein n=1 Tax=Streptomyces gamaensis TaxID=1763542 RepID=UPI0036F3F63E
MPSPEARVDCIAARLSAAGFAPRLRDHDDYTQVEVDVPDQVPAARWGALLEALLRSGADWWGLGSTRHGRRIAWAGVNKDPRGSCCCPGAWPSAVRS